MVMLDISLSLSPGPVRSLLLRLLGVHPGPGHQSHEHSLASGLPGLSGLSATSRQPGLHQGQYSARSFLVLRSRKFFT